MSTVELIEIIKNMPANQQKEVEDFVLAMNSKDNSVELGNNKALLAEAKVNYGRGYGSLKGQIWMSDDFNEPLEDFKDYM